MVRLDETSLIQVISARPHRMVCCGPNPPLSPREYADTEGPRNSRKYTCVWNSSSPIKRFLRAHEIRYGALPVARKIRTERALCKFERDPVLGIAWSSPWIFNPFIEATKGKRKRENLLAMFL